MAIVLLGLTAMGGLVMLVGGILILIAAFKENIWWGLGSLLLPIVALVFVAMHWDRSRKGFLIWVAGFTFTIICVVLVGPLASGPSG